MVSTMAAPLDTAATAPPAGPAEAPVGLSIRSYLNILLKRKWLILGVLAIVLGGGTLATFRQERIYQARLSAIIDTNAPQVLGGNVREVVDLGTGNYWMSRDYLASQRNIIQSRELALRVVDQLRLQDVPQFWLPGQYRPGHTREEAAARVQSGIQVAALKENRVIEIYYRHVDPTVAARVCNAVGDAYLEFNLDHKLGSTRSAVKWLADQLDDLKKDLNQAELALHDFKKQNNVLAVPLEDKQNLLTRQIEKLNDHLTEMRMKRMDLTARRRQIVAARNADPLKEAATPLVDSPMIADLKRSYIEELRRLVELREKYLERHPLVRAQQAKVDAAMGHLRREIDNILASTEGKYNEAADAERQLAGTLEGAKQEALALNLKQIEYNRLKRSQDNTEKLYGLVLTRLKESDLAAQLRVNNIRVLDRAVQPNTPISPNVTRNLLAALVLGLLAGIGLAVLVEALDTTVKSQEEIEAISAVPFLGVLPSIESVGGNGSLKLGNATVDPRKDLYLHTHPKSSVAECARSIRTNLLFMSPEKALGTIMVTSPGPREGKTTTAISLAIAMAQGGERLLLVDTDLRRPRVHRAFGVGGERGLTSALMGQSTLDEAIKTTDIPNLWVLPCGPLPPNPAELLHTQRFSTIIDSLRGRFDRIIFDSPPVIAVTDAAVLSAKLDGVLVVVKAGQTAREGLRRSVRVLKDVGANLLGCVLNDLDLTSRSYGQYYYYYYRRYGYAYRPTGEAAEGGRDAS
jgi:capsular exopolysaccharide synthesis family protein